MLISVCRTFIHEKMNFVGNNKEIWLKMYKKLIVFVERLWFENDSRNFLDERWEEKLVQQWKKRNLSFEVPRMHSFSLTAKCNFPSRNAIIVKTTPTLIGLKCWKQLLERAAERRILYCFAHRKCLKPRSVPIQRERNMDKSNEQVNLFYSLIHIVNIFLARHWSEACGYISCSDSKIWWHNNFNLCIKARR